MMNHDFYLNLKAQTAQKFIFYLILYFAYKTSIFDICHAIRG